MGEQKSGNIRDIKKNQFELNPINPLNTAALKFSPNSWLAINQKANASYRVSFNLKVLSWHANEKYIGNEYLEVASLNDKLHRNAILMNVSEPQKVLGDLVAKGEIIGYVPELGEIFIKDITKEEMEAYKNFIDKMSERSDKKKQEEINNLNKLIRSESNKINQEPAALALQQIKKDGRGYGLTNSDLDNCVSKNGWSLGYTPKVPHDEEIKNSREISLDKRNFFQKIIDPIKSNLKL